MSTYTENYNLIKPDETDYYDVQDFNENMDTLDSTMAEIESGIGTIDKKMGSSTDTTSESVFGKLNDIADAVSQGASAVKSIQRVTTSLSMKNESKTETINAVNVSRCIVISETLCQTSYPYSYGYTLNGSSLSVSTSSANSGTVSLGFWIIEFC